ncbi:MAG TPA: hypothetical protein VOB72_01865 [Candidatus Dormibacteraeota bacterium]|nr:hypothetical protein [Candidatus Dormibacteraeota bacterium]
MIAAGAAGLLALVLVETRPWAAGQPAPAPAAAPQPDLTSTMDWLSAGDGWLAALDRPAGRTTLFHTPDAGRTWTRLRTSVAVETVAFADARHGVLYGPSATLRTTDGGRHWRALTLPDGAEGQRPVFADAVHGWVWDPLVGALYGTADGGERWRPLSGLGLPDDGPEALGFRDALHGWATAPAGPEPPALYTSGDGGEGWSARPVPPPPGGWPAGRQFAVGPPAIGADGHGVVLIGEFIPWGFLIVASAYWVAATADGGATWGAARPLPAVRPGTVVTLAGSPATGAVAWAWSADELLLTRDGGATWARAAVPDGGSIDRLQAVGTDGAWAAASVAGGRWALFSTADGGVTWRGANTPALR